LVKSQSKVKTGKSPVEVLCSSLGGERSGQDELDSLSASQQLA
jgi:hypothetical protein